LPSTSVDAKKSQESLSLWRIHRRQVHHDHPIVLSPVVQGRATRERLHLLGDPLAPGVRNGRKSSATPLHLRSPNRSLTGTTCTLLTERLSAAALHLRTGLGRTSALSLVQEIGAHNLVHHALIYDAVEERIGESPSLTLLAVLFVVARLIHGRHFEISR